MEGIARNLKFAWRALAAKPSFTLTVVLTLALGIGALASTSLLAAWIPARRAARVDPLRALRYE